MNDSGLRHLAHDPKRSSEWAVCPNGHFSHRGSPGPTVCSTCEQPLKDLYVEQRRLVWADESTIVAQALLKNGKADPSIVLGLLMSRTCRNANFPLDVDAIENPDLGWYLYQWLGGVTLIKRLTGQGDERKNSKPGSETPQKASEPEPTTPSVGIGT